jgi:2OG-Fe(II) oxygenase superfamily
MVTEWVLGTLVAAAGAIALLKWRRGWLYRSLGERLERLLATAGFDLSQAVARAIPSFEDRLAVLPAFLPLSVFETLRREAESLVSPERSYVPTHKKGGTIAYETLIEAAPQIVSFYHCPQLMKFVSRIVGVSLVPTPLYDQSSLSVLVYEKPGDHIGWHYDHNFYRGRHFTVLLALDNRGSAEGGLSHATLKARAGGSEVSVSTSPNTMVVFEGAAVRHKVTPILEGERRLMLSMTYCTDPGASLLQGVTRRIKDIAFFGPRALWT